MVCHRHHSSGVKNYENTYFNVVCFNNRTRTVNLTWWWNLAMSLGLSRGWFLEVEAHLAEQRRQKIPHGVQTGAVTVADDMQGPVGRKLMILQRTVVKRWRRTKCSENVSLEKRRTRERMWRGKDTELRGDEVDAVSLIRLIPGKRYLKIRLNYPIATMILPQSERVKAAEKWQFSPNLCDGGAAF